MFVFAINNLLLWKACPNDIGYEQRNLLTKSVKCVVFIFQETNSFLTSLIPNISYTLQSMDGMDSHITVKPLLFPPLLTTPAKNVRMWM